MLMNDGFISPEFVISFVMLLCIFDVLVTCYIIFKMDQK